MTNKQACECGSTQFEYDIIDLMGDGVEADFGKSVEICASCRKSTVIED